MPKHKDFTHNIDTIPANAFLDPFQELLSSYASGFVIEKESATSIRIVAGTINDQVGISLARDANIAVWKYRTSTVSASHPGGAEGIYDIWATGTAPDVVPPDTDNTDYNFVLEIRASGSPPTAYASRKLGTVDWDGAKITAIHQTVGRLLPSVTLVGDKLPLTERDGEIMHLRVGTTPFDFLALVYDATYDKWVSPVLAETKINEYVCPTSASYDLVPGSAVVIPKFKDYHDAGLRLQLQLAGAFQDNGVPPTSVWLSPVIHEADVDEAWASLVAAADGNALIGGSADNDENVEFKDWFQPTVTPTKDHLLLRGATRMTGVSTDLNVNNAVIRARLVSA